MAKAKGEKKDLREETRKSAHKVLDRVLDRNWNEIFGTYRAIQDDSGAGKPLSMRVGLGLVLEPHKGDVRVKATASFGVKTKDEDVDYASIHDRLPGMQDPATIEQGQAEADAREPEAFDERIDKDEEGEES
jgi:hypothetical protein